MERQINFDRLSSLPWDVLDAILVHLPLKDAVRTAVLSRKWRYKWAQLSQYVFDDKCFPSSLLHKVARWEFIGNIFEQIRLHNSGPIEKFKLSAYCHPNHPELGQWIQLLTERGIKELILEDFDSPRRFQLPPCLFSCPQLSRLELYGCLFKLPSSFSGFQCLAILRLTEVSIDNDTLESLIVNCTVLEKLTLLRIDGASSLNVHNQNLKYLRIDCYFDDICLRNSPLLTSVDISLTIGSGNKNNLVSVLGSISGVRRLTLNDRFLEFLAGNDVPGRLPNTLDQLAILNLRELQFDSLEEVQVALSILKSSPNLEELLVSIGYQYEPSRHVLELMLLQSEINMFFPKLRSVRIRGLWGTRAELEFIRFIFARTPVLEMVTLVTYGAERFPETLLQQLDRASEHVQVLNLTL